MVCIFVIFVLSLKLTTFPFVFLIGIDDDVDDFVVEHYDSLGFDASFRSWSWAIV